MQNNQINIREFGTKFQSKNEIYRFLVTEVNMHLPPQKECSIYFVRDILSKRKKAFCNDEILVKVVPHIENLRIKDLIWFLENKCTDAIDFLPEDYHKKSLNRQWLCNLCRTPQNHNLGNTFNPIEFQKLIDLAIKEREEKYLEKHSMILETDPKIVSAFHKSSFISTTKGRSHMLLRKSKSDNRASDSHEEDKEEIKLIDDKDSHIKKLQKEVEKLREELDVSKETVEKRDKYADLLNDLFHKGIIDSDGNFIHEED